MACGKTSVRKKPVKPLPACKNLVVQVKIQAGLWHVLHTWWYVLIISVSACGEGDWCHYFVLFVTCTIYCLYITLQSQDDDFHPHDTLIVQLYEICDSPRITVIQTLFSGIITYIHYANAFTNHVTITLWEGVVRLVQCCLWSPISCVCVQEQGCQTSAPFFVTASLH